MKQHLYTFIDHPIDTTRDPSSYSREVWSYCRPLSDDELRLWRMERVNPITVNGHRLTLMSPVPLDDGCDLSVGDVVRYTNEYGVVFEPRRVTGFALPGGDVHGRSVYINCDSPWLPVKSTSLATTNAAIERLERGE